MLLPNNLKRRIAARRLRTGPTIIQTDFLGCKMLVRPQEDVGRNMALGEFETDDLQHFIGAVHPGDIVYDIGANVGAYCVPIAKAIGGARVFAFEPIELNAALIRVSLLVNRLHNVELNRMCVSDVSGTVQFSLAEDSAYSSMLDTGRKVEVEKLSCPAVSLDDFCADASHPPPNVMKIDVEGAELKVLEGAARLFEAEERRPKLVLIELYDQNLNAFGTSIDQILRRMTGWGYRAYVLVDGKAVSFATAHHNVHYNVFFTR